MIKNFTSTKEKILVVLKKAHESSMKDIMEFFDLSEIAIRRHLRDLIRQKLVSEQSVKQEIGRPYKVYRLTQKGHDIFPNQYKQLPLQMLQDIEELYGEDLVKKLFDKRKEREIEQFSSQINANNFNERIKQLVNLQTENGQMIELNQVENGYEIINYNCPIYNIASSYVHVCTNEKEVLERVFPNSEIVSHKKIADGYCHCKWTISKPKE